MFVYSLCCCCVLVALSYGSALQQDGFYPVPRWPMTPPVAMHGFMAPVEKNFQQELDHFNSVGFWRQRYYENLQFYEAGGPVFVMQADQAATPDWLTGGQMMELALTYHAKAYILEQRFYGKSQPTNDTSMESFQFFTPEQTLADLAAFVTFLRKETPGVKVIAFGGSFAGNLVTWARSKYPDLINGAVVSSAPLEAKFNFQEYFEDVARVMTLSKPTCVADMQNAIQTLDFLVESEGGAQFITGLFNLCDPLDTNNKMDISNIYTAFANVYAIAVQNAVSVSHVADTCDLITNPMYGETPFERLVALSALMVGSGSCFEYKYDHSLEMFTNTAWDSLATVSGRRQYLYQTCSEFADFQTSASHKQPFGMRFMTDVFLQICTDFYDKKFDATYVETAVNTTNAVYGGKAPNVTQVVFVNGNLDPWRLQGVTTGLSATATAIVIDGTSHIRDMATASAADPLVLTNARKTIKTLVGNWIL